jgi:hypothetical protein
VLPARTAYPRDKAVVEVGVEVAERWVLAPLRKHRVILLGEMNAAIFEKVKECWRLFRGEPTSRRELFVELERPALQPMPPIRYEFASVKTATVKHHYHVEFDHHWYSTPYSLVRRKAVRLGGLQSRSMSQASAAPTRFTATIASSAAASDACSIRGPASAEPTGTPE